MYKYFLHGRVSVTHKTCYELISEDRIYTCELIGNMLYGRAYCEYPCTGDWVIFQYNNPDKGIILEILPRKKTLCRSKSGITSEKQVITSYVGKVLIVQNLDNNFNVRRIERFVLQVAAEDIQP